MHKAVHAVVFSLGFSKSLAAFIIAIHVFAALMVCLLPLPLWVQMLLWIGVGWMAHHAGQRFLSRSHKRSIVSLWQDSRGRWGFTLEDGRCLRGHLSHDTFKHPYLLVVGLRTATCTHYVPIPRDRLDAFAFRTLSTRLSFYEAMPS